MLARWLSQGSGTVSEERGRGMKRGGIIILAGVLGLVALLLAGSAGAFPPERPMAQGGAPTLISYQGLLTDPGTGDPVADGDYSITFALYEVESGGSPIWSETQIVTVSGGLFNVLLGSVNPLSASDFSGPDRWLGIQVEADPAMTPRQRIASVPYALQAQEAVNADTVDGQDSSAFAPASHTHSGSEYQNVIVVAKSGGDFASIQAALDSIDDNSDTNRYLVWVAPGTYTDTVTMKQYVDIEGSGELLTKITAAGSGSIYAGTVVGVNNAELRFLTVENTGGDAYGVAIYNISGSPRLTFVTATASGATYSIGVFNKSSSPTMTNVTVSALGVTVNYGVYNHTCSPTMTNVTVTASGGSAANTGIYNGATSGSHTMKVDNSRITGSTNTINSITGFTVLVGASQLAGGPVTDGNTVTCAGVYDENYTFYANTCPP